MAIYRYWHLLSTNGGKVYRHSGFTSTIAESFTTPTTIGSALRSAITDGTDLILFKSATPSQVFKMSGFSSTIKDSFTLGTGINSAESGTWDGQNLWILDYATDKVYKHSGFSSTVLDSFSISTLSTSATGLTTDGRDLWVCGSGKIFKLSGFSSTTTTTSFSTFGVNATGLIWSGTDFYTTDWSTSVIYKHAGYSATTSSFSGPASWMTGVGMWYEICPDGDLLTTTVDDGKVRRHYGQTFLIKDSFTFPVGEGVFPGSATWDGTDLYIVDQEAGTNNHGVVFQMSGFSSVIKRSFELIKSSSSTLHFDHAEQIIWLPELPNKFIYSTASLYDEAYSKIFFYDSWDGVITNSISRIDSSSLIVGITTDGLNLYHFEQGINTIYKHSGFTSTTTASIDVDTIISDYLAEHIAWDGKDMLLHVGGSAVAGKTWSKVIKLSGFTTTVLYSYFTPAAWGLGCGWMYDYQRGKDVIHVDPNTQIVYRHHGFTHLIKQSFTHDANINASGMCWDSTSGNLFIADTSATTAIWRMSGFSSTVAGSFNSPSTSPTGVVISGGNAYTTDNVSNRLYTHNGFTSTTTASWAITTMTGGASSITGMTSDGTNLIFVANSNNTIYKCAGFTSTTSTSMLAATTNTGGLAWDGTDLYEIDYVGSGLGTLFRHSGFTTTVKSSINVLHAWGMGVALYNYLDDYNVDWLGLGEAYFSSSGILAYDNMSKSEYAECLGVASETKFEDIDDPAEYALMGIGEIRFDETGVPSEYAIYLTAVLESQYDEMGMTEYASALGVASELQYDVKSYAEYAVCSGVGSENRYEEIVMAEYASILYAHSTSVFDNVDISEAYYFELYSDITEDSIGVSDYYVGMSVGYIAHEDIAAPTEYASCSGVASVLPFETMSLDEYASVLGAVSELKYEEMSLTEYAAALGVASEVKYDEIGFTEYAIASGVASELMYEEIGTAEYAAASGTSSEIKYDDIAIEEYSELYTAVYEIRYDEIGTAEYSLASLFYYDLRYDEIGTAEYAEAYGVASELRYDEIGITETVDTSGVGATVIYDEMGFTEYASVYGVASELRYEEASYTELAEYMSGVLSASYDEIGYTEYSEILISYALDLAFDTIGQSEYTELSNTYAIYDELHADDVAILNSPTDVIAYDEYAIEEYALTSYGYPAPYESTGTAEDVQTATGIIYDEAIAALDEYVELAHGILSYEDIATDDFTAIYFPELYIYDDIAVTEDAAYDVPGQSVSAYDNVGNEDPVFLDITGIYFDDMSLSEYSDALSSTAISAFDSTGNDEYSELLTAVYVDAFDDLEIFETYYTDTTSLVYDDLQIEDGYYTLSIGVAPYDEIASPSDVYATSTGIIWSEEKDLYEYVHTSTGETTYGSFCWGHDTGVDEQQWTDLANGSGTATIENTGDTEMIGFNEGEVWTLNTVYTGVIDSAYIMLNKYVSGDTSEISTRYRTGATQIACEAAPWNVWDGTKFNSLGYVQLAFVAGDISNFTTYDAAHVSEYGAAALLDQPVYMGSDRAYMGSDPVTW